MSGSADVTVITTEANSSMVLLIEIPAAARILSAASCIYDLSLRGERRMHFFVSAELISS